MKQLSYDYDLPYWQWCFHVTRHPFEGFEDMRCNKRYSVRISLIIVAVSFLISIAASLFTGFLFAGAQGMFNIIPHVSMTFVAFAAWVAANWAICTLLDGEGKLPAIICVSAYSLVPYLISRALNIVLSNVLVESEGAFIHFIAAAGVIWSLIMIVMGMKAAHQYSMPKAVGSVILTVLGMAVILFIALLLISLFQHIFVFAYSVYTEIMYRVSY